MWKKVSAGIFLAFVLASQISYFPPRAGSGGGSVTLGFGLVDIAGAASVNRAVTTVHEDLQAGGALYCAGSASTTATCSLNPALTAYTDGMLLNFKAGATNTTTYTLNIDGQGAKSILTSTGASLSAGDITSGVSYLIRYDGTNFRLPAGGAASATLTQAWSPYGGLDQTGGTSSVTGGTSLLVHYVPLSLQSGRTLNALIGYPSTASGNIAVGIYNSSCTLLGQSTTAVAPGNNPTTWTFSTPVNLPAGDYFLAWTSTATGDKWQGNGTNWVGALYNQGLSGSTLVYFTGATAATGSSPITMPPSCGVKTAEATSGAALPAWVLR